MTHHRTNEGSSGPDSTRDVTAFDGARATGGTAQETLELHRLLVESVRDYAIFALDTTGHILTWNPGAERFKGWTAEEVIGRHFSIFYPLEDLANDKPGRELRDAERYGSIEDEGWRVRKDGTQFWASVVITALRDDQGRLVGFAKVTRDLTERREAEQRLRESEERFRLLVQNVKDYAIFMLDPTGHIATWNEGAQRIKGYTAEEIIGRHFSIFYPEPKASSGFPQYELEQAALHGSFEDEGDRVKKDGTTFWASVVITALRDEHQRLVGYAKVTRDLTERRKAQQQALADAKRVAEVEAVNRAKSDFLAMLSHELRTPLNAIGGYAELLALQVSGPVTEQQQLYLSRIRVSQQHLLRLVNDLLNLSKLEGDALHHEPSEVAVKDVVDGVHSMIVPLASRKQIAVEAVGCTNAAMIVWADFARVQQILLNLLSNAVKFTPAEGRVTIDCTADERTVAISVADTGPGIPAAQQEAIFEPFVQLGRSYTEPSEGIGLGLAISRDLARAMSGDLTLTSVPGEGSTFTLTLPVGPAPVVDE